MFAYIEAIESIVLTIPLFERQCFSTIELQIFLLITNF